MSKQLLDRECRTAAGPSRTETVHVSTTCCASRVYARRGRAKSDPDAILAELVHEAVLVDCQRA